MKRILFYKWLLVVAICLFMGSCQQLADEEWESGEEGTLNIKTRSAVDEDIVYPLNLYAFSSGGDCVASQTVKDKDESVRLSLPAGKYKVVAISGYSDDYQIPATPALNDVIQMEGESGADVPLMTGKADVTVGADKESRLEMTLSYAVTALDLVLSNVPSDVSKVSVTLSSFYSSMSIKGEYRNADYALTMDCTLNTGNQWRTKTRYVFPGTGSETTLSIAMKLKSGEEVTYGYVWKDAPKAGQPYHLQGEYTDGFSLSGSFVITGWNEAEDVEFTFGAVTSTDDGKEDGGEDDEPEIDLSKLPEIGSIWNGTIVADIVEADESGADLLLMSLDEWDATVSEVEDVASGYTVNNLSDWRLPTFEEAKLFQSIFSGNNRLELNELIAEYDASLWGIDGEERYLCDKSGVYYTFIFAGGRVISKAGTKKSYYVRLVRSYRMEF